MDFAEFHQEFPIQTDQTEKSSGPLKTAMDLIKFQDGCQNPKLKIMTFANYGIPLLVSKAHRRMILMSIYTNLVGL